MLAVETGVLGPWIVAPGMAADEPSAAGDTLAAAAEDVLEGTAADEPGVAAVAGLAAGVGVGVVAIVARFEAAGVDSAAAVGSGATAGAFAGATAGAFG